jgi:hypothetical protein
MCCFRRTKHRFPWPFFAPSLGRLQRPAERSDHLPRLSVTVAGGFNVVGIIIPKKSAGKKSYNSYGDFGLTTGTRNELCKRSWLTWRISFFDLQKRPCPACQSRPSKVSSSYWHGAINIFPCVPTKNDHWICVQQKKKIHPSYMIRIQKKGGKLFQALERFYNLHIST